MISCQCHLDHYVSSDDFISIKKREDCLLLIIVGNMKTENDPEKPVQYFQENLCF